MGFKTKSWSNDLDDLGVTHQIIGNLHQISKRFWNPFKKGNVADQCVDIATQTVDVKQTISAWIPTSIGPSRWTLDLFDLAADTKSRAQFLGTSGKTTTQDWKVSSATSLGVQIGRNKRGMSFTVWFEWWFAGFTALPSADSWGMVLEALSCSDGWCPDSNQGKLLSSMVKKRIQTPKGYPRWLITP